MGILRNNIRMQISATPGAQQWLSQFLPKDRGTAEKLLDQLVYVSTEEVINALGIRITELLERYSKVAILPVREIEKIGDDTNNKQLMSYFSLDDNDAVPEMQAGGIPLGSEAFISNLVTQLSRRYKDKIISHEANRLNPSINNLRDQRVKSLILVDDLIGSGNRTKDFLESIYSHPTIKSWLSGKQIEIHVVSFMASELGETAVRRWTNKYKNSFLHVLNKCPMIDITQTDIHQLCIDYAHKGEKFPIGYGDNPVRVVFSHSAPNNLPAILYRNTARLKTKNIELRAIVKSWKALFSGRAISESLKTELTDLKPVYSIKQLLTELLSSIETNPGLSIDELNNQFSGTNAQLDLCINRCINFHWIENLNEKFSITESGHSELEYIYNRKKIKGIANNEENYYPTLVIEP
jgi:hypothetical protein